MTSSKAPAPAHVELLAAALYEIRLLLGAHRPSRDKSCEAEAASLAYALHNDALAVLRGQSFDLDAALARIAIVDTRLDTNLTERLRRHQVMEKE